MLNQTEVDRILQTALTEDIGTGDITTLSTVPADKIITGTFIAKEAGVICGLPIAARVFELMDEKEIFQPLVQEGARVHAGEQIAQVQGNARSILTAERVALNFLQRLSGIATATACAVAKVQGTQAKITDTRKTTPGLRLLEKYAVRIGGGVNHRFNLSSAILIKDNHIAASGGITNAITQTRKNAPKNMKIEVEAENFAQIKEALACQADIILLDNMTIENMKKAVKIIAGRALTEASGNMGDRDLCEVAKTGVDLISIGALTHTVRAMDISLRFV